MVKCGMMKVNKTEGNEEAHMLKLPENFESYGDARKNGFLKMKELKEAGRRLVGAYCSFVPSELVEAAGGTVVSLCVRENFNNVREGE